MTFQLTLDADAIPKDVAKDLYVSVRVGEAQKLSKFCPSRTFRFPKSAVGDRRVGKVELFKRIAGHSIEIHAGAKQHLQEVPFEHVEPGLKFQVSLDGPPPPDPEIAAKLSKPKAAAAKEYMERHGLELRLSEAMQSVLRELPDDPISALCSALQQVKAAVKKMPLPEPSGKAQAAAEEPKEPSKEEEDARVEEQVEEKAKESATEATQASETVVAEPPAARQEYVAEPPAEPPALWPESEGTAPAGELSSVPAEETVEEPAAAEQESPDAEPVVDVVEPVKPQEDAKEEELSKADAQLEVAPEEPLPEDTQESKPDEAIVEAEERSAADVQATVEEERDGVAQASPQEKVVEDLQACKDDQPEADPVDTVEDPTVQAKAEHEPSMPEQANLAEAAAPQGSERETADEVAEPTAQVAADGELKRQKEVEIARLAAREAVRASLERAAQVHLPQDSAPVPEPSFAPVVAPALEEPVASQPAEEASVTALDAAEATSAPGQVEPSREAPEEEVSSAPQEAAPPVEEPQGLEAVRSAVRECLLEATRTGSLKKALDAASGTVMADLRPSAQTDCTVVAAEVEAEAGGATSSTTAEAAGEPSTQALAIAGVTTCPTPSEQQPRQLRPAQVINMSALYGASFCRTSTGFGVRVL